MSFALTSHMSLQAAISQYRIDCDAPVALTLYGPESYCNLKAIQNPQLKEILAKVGNAFEMQARCGFFNVSHTFTPTEVTDGKGKEKLDKQDQVKDIFVFIKTALAEQTDGSLALGLTDMTRLVVNKAEDRCRLQPIRSYELGITVSEKAIATAEKSGLMFRKFPLSTEKTAYCLGVGQTSF